MAYTCHLCNDAEQASILITPLSGGDTLAIGPNCLVTGYCGLLSVLMDVDAEQLYDGLVALQAATKAAQAAAQAGKSARRPAAARKPRAAKSGQTLAAVPDSGTATS